MNRFSLSALRAALVGLLLAAPALHPALAAPFEIAATPSRFEVSTSAGKRLGQSLEISNLGAEATEVSMRTLDWSLSPEGDVTYFDALQPGSCRPWVTLERRTLKVPARGKASFRFQVDPPADAPRGECRFMVAIEGVEPAYRADIQKGGASLALPVTGRLAVVVYVALNGAEPKITLSQVGMKEAGGKRTPVVTVSNEGDAHGRLDGALQAVDARGTEFEMVPDGSPILPGQKRSLVLNARGEGSKPVQPVYPVKVKGVVDWDKGGFKVEAELR